MTFLAADAVAEPGARPLLAIVGPFLAAPPDTADRSLAESLRLLVMGS